MEIKVIVKMVFTPIDPLSLIFSSPECILSIGVL